MQTIDARRPETRAYFWTGARSSLGGIVVCTVGRDAVRMDAVYR